MSAIFLLNFFDFVLWDVEVLGNGEGSDHNMLNNLEILQLICILSAVGSIVPNFVPDNVLEFFLEPWFAHVCFLLLKEDLHHQFEGLTHLHPTCGISAVLHCIPDLLY